MKRYLKAIFPIFKLQKIWNLDLKFISNFNAQYNNQRQLQQMMMISKLCNASLKNQVCKLLGAHLKQKQIIMMIKRHNASLKNHAYKLQDVQVKQNHMNSQAVSFTTQEKQFQGDGADFFVKFSQKQRDRNGIFIPFAIKSIPKDCESLVDLGCGSSYYHGRILQKRSKIKNLIGLDISKRMIEMVSENLKKRKGNQYIQHNLVFPFPLKKKVECMISLFTLQYMDWNDLNSYIKNCYDGLASQGKLIFISMEFYRFKNHHPNISKFITFQVCFENDYLKDGEKFISKIANHSKELSLIFWKTQTIISIMEANGFKAQCQYLTAQIVDPKLFTAEEIQMLVNSKMFRCITGIKRNPDRVSIL